MKKKLDRGETCVIKICEKTVRVSQGTAVNRPSAAISQGGYIIEQGQLHFVQ